MGVSLAWVPKNGRFIHPGEDPIIGGPISFVLSTGLIGFFRENGFYTLDQVAIRWNGRRCNHEWIWAHQPGLNGSLGLEWSPYIFRPRELIFNCLL